jgi:hypothetical protein
MIDFQNGAFFKLGPADPQPIAAELAPILVDGEQVYLCFKGMRDYVVFTNKRLIAVNVQGLTGKKRDYSSLPYNKIQAWSIETAGRFDRPPRALARTPDESAHHAEVIGWKNSGVRT